MKTVTAFKKKQPGDLNARIAGEQAAAMDYMGPARVLQVSPPHVLARRSDGREVTLQLALAVDYQPAVGDTMLVVGGRSGDYAIGVIDGAGKSSLSVSGDIDVHAVNGTLNLRGDHGVQLHGPEVEVVSDKLKVIAGSAVQKVATLYQHVRELWSMKSKSAHIAVADDFYQRSKSTTILTEEVVTINGKQIHLG